ncbi:alpha/beta hydrolase [Candidatus Peribacteria bacterium]|nr:MAG: alpha/beta hydrolase [Candidatus Peribacteria bacterium]
MSASETYLLRLPDNRMLEYAAYGDPHGKTVVYFHGFLGSCHQAALADTCGRDLGLRIIAPNRPGIGQSTPHVFPSMTDYAEDIRYLLDALDVERAAFIGVSSGGCFALACSYAMPERTQLTGVAGCIGPLNVIRNLQSMHWFRRYFLSGCNDYPWITGSLLRIVFTVCKFRPQWLYQWLVNTSSLLEPGLMVPQDTVKKVLWNDYKDVFLQANGVQGLLQEARLFFHWGFAPSDFPKEKRVFFWHGKNDPLVPWSIARNLAKHIHRTQVVLFPGGHMTFLTKVESILSRVSAVWEDAPTFNESTSQELHSSASYPVLHFA